MENRSTKTSWNLQKKKRLVTASLTYSGLYLALNTWKLRVGGQEGVFGTQFYVKRGPDWMFIWVTKESIVVKS